MIFPKHLFRRVSPRIYFIFYNIKNKFRTNKINAKNKFRSREFNVLPIDEMAVSRHLITNTSEINVEFPNVLGLANHQKIKIKVQPKYFYKIEDVEIIVGNDFLIKGEAAYWDKMFNMPAFPHILPMDKNLISYDKQVISLREDLTSEEVLYIEEAFFFCGVHSEFWSHFLVERLPQLKILKERIIPEAPNRIKIVLPSNIDLHSRELAKEYMGDLADFIYVDQRVKIKCKNLWFVDRMSWLSDHANEMSILDNLIEPNANDFLLRYRGNIEDPRKKLFLERTGIRNLTNYQDVRSFFIQNDYTMVTPHELTLSKKKHLFASASHIVGPFSSAFANLIFCSPSVKVLDFANFSRCFDSYYCSLIEKSENFYMLPGIELQKGNPHSNYYIGLNDIIKYSKKLGFV
jgi:capsular polysaccharide biosynthesis protein